MFRLYSSQIPQSRLPSWCEVDVLTAIQRGFGGTDQCTKSHAQTFPQRHFLSLISWTAVKSAYEYA
jgi:hypothetical protein